MSISVILEYLGKALNAERTYIFEKNVQGRDDNTYEWVANGVTPEKDHLQNVPSEVCASWYNRFREGKHIVIDNLEKIKVENPMQYEVLKGQDIILRQNLWIILQICCRLWGTLLCQL